MYIYDALLRNRDQTFLIEIPDFDISVELECNRREAIEHAAHALRTAIQGRLASGRELTRAENALPDKRSIEVITLALEETMPVEGVVTTEQAMQMLGVSQSRIAHLIRDERLKAVTQGRRKLITSASLEAYLATPRKPGRPKKGKSYAYVNQEQEA